MTKEGLLISWLPGSDSQAPNQGQFHRLFPLQAAETPAKSPFSKGGFRGIFSAPCGVKAKSPLAPSYERGEPGETRIKVAQIMLSLSAIEGNIRKETAKSLGCHLFQIFFGQCLGHRIEAVLNYYKLPLF